MNLIPDAQPSEYHEQEGDDAAHSCSGLCHEVAEIWLKSPQLNQYLATDMMPELVIYLSGSMEHAWRHFATMTSSSA